ncbi:unnamed protein product [Menidia menidia]|uniref:(Atlantic silverside) hypothetical protein n=1 Tax=Menidia menidia TaxID=238744 RepID=A0A8S4AXC8_9TELE|nr:unnamed protein product [Menidia menidia]
MWTPESDADVLVIQKQSFHGLEEVPLCLNVGKEVGEVLFCDMTFEMSQNGLRGVMEAGGFQSQLLAVMEVLAKAAVAEINRRVDDSCAVLRLEVSQSRRDIELLKSKCEALEADLRRSRMRARRKGAAPSPFTPLVLLTESPQGNEFSISFMDMPPYDKQDACSPPADETLPSSAKEAFPNAASADWDPPMEVENVPQQCADVEAADEAQHIHIKEELKEEDMWRTDPKDKEISEGEQLPQFGATPPPQEDFYLESHGSAQNPAHPEALLSPGERYQVYPEQREESAGGVKRERPEGANGTDPRFVEEDEEEEEEVEGQLWSPAGLPFPGPQIDPAPARFPPRSHSALLSAARARRRARTFACRRLQPEDGPAAPPPLAPPRPPPSTHADPDGEPAVSLFRPGHGGVGLGVGVGGFLLTRRMRAAWRPGHGEKRFSCTFCDKSFMRFSQLKEHLRSHTGEKPFSCAQCGRSFTKQCNLIRHAVVHSGEKPYQCAQCGKCFTQRSSLKKHPKGVQIDDLRCCGNATGDLGFSEAHHRNTLPPPCLIK